MQMADAIPTDDLFVPMSGRACAFVKSATRSGETFTAAVDRLFGLIDTPGGEPAKLPRRAVLTRVLMTELHKVGGTSTSRSLVRSIEARLILTKSDRAMLSPGVPRWRKDLTFCRLNLSRRTPPLLKASRVHGVWELTDLGMRVAAGYDGTRVYTLPDSERPTQRRAKQNGKRRC